MRVVTDNGQQKKFKDLEISSYFIYENKVWQKQSKTKIREFGTSNDKITRKNFDVLFLGFDVSDFLEM